ncbi:unnamed protein product [Leuciscus chuanchicus]
MSANTVATQKRVREEFSVGVSVSFCKYTLKPICGGVDYKTTTTESSSELLKVIKRKNTLCLTHELNQKAKRSPRRKESEGLQDGLFSASEKSLFSTLSMKCIPILAGSRQSDIRVSVPWRLEVEPRDSWVFGVSSTHSSGGLSGGVRVQRRLKLLEPDVGSKKRVHRRRKNTLGPSEVPFYFNSMSRCLLST